MDLEFAKAQGLELGPEVMVGSPGGAGRPGHLATVKQVQLGGLRLGGMMVVAFTGLPFKGADPPRGVLGPYALSGAADHDGLPALAAGVHARRAAGAGRPRDLRLERGSAAAARAHHRLPARRSTSTSTPGRAYASACPTSCEKTLPLAAPPVDAGRARTVDQDVPAQTATLKGALTIGRYTLENPVLHVLGAASGGRERRPAAAASSSRSRSIRRIAGSGSRARRAASW